MVLMNRNTPASDFQLAPTTGIPRSRKSVSFGCKTSFNVGELIPLCRPIFVLPSDTFRWKTSFVARLQTLKTPVYDNLYFDTYFFFVPARLVWEHWVNLMGENTQSAWIPQTTYTVPQVTSPDSTGWTVGTLADYFGIPTGVAGISVNALPFRCYAKIVDDWFKDENLQDPPNLSVNDSTVAGSNGDNYITDLIKGGKPFIACKLRDYFTTALPSPQRGVDTVVPLVNGGSDLLPVFTQPDVNAYYGGSDYLDHIKDSHPLFFDDGYTSLVDGEPAPGFLQGLNQYSTDPKGISINIGTDQRPFLPATHGSDSKRFLGKSISDIHLDYGIDGLVPVNLVATASGTSYAASVNTLRTAFQIQRLLERDARGGTRYIELIRSHFMTDAGDARLQRSEYLGGQRSPLNISQVTQLGSTTESSPLGDVAGMSVTANINFDFEKSFTEHGYIIALGVARYDHSYQQGLDRLWSVSDRYSFYWPSLACLGEQEVLQQEIYCDGSSDDGLVFGFQERWAEYRHNNNMITGELRSQYSASLDMWHFADYYQSAPYLSSSWIQEDKSNVDRTLAVTSSVSNQIFADFYFDIVATRPMPLFSIPGLIDHN